MRRVCSFFAMTSLNAMFSGDRSANTLEATVLFLKVLQASNVSRLHAAVFGLPDVVRGARDAQLAAHTFDSAPTFDLLQRRNNPTLGELALARPRSPLGLICSEASSYAGIKFAGS